MSGATGGSPKVRAGSLHILAKRTRGGLAEIFLALDGAGQQVIMRRLRPLHRLNLSMRRRFAEGIRIRRELGVHPNIVRYMAERGGLLPFEVIEYVPGDSLKSLIVNRHRVVTETPFAILRQAIYAVGHMHERGYLHLDVKAENFLVNFTSDGCVVKLTDFDFSKPVGTQKVSRKFGGSLMYSPPEFLSSKSVSRATDTFAIGVMAYLLFTFQMPFVESSHDLVKGNGNGQLKFSGTSSRLSPALQSFLEQALNPRPEGRFVTCGTMLKALDRTEMLHQGQQKGDTRTPGQAGRGPGRRG